MAQAIVFLRARSCLAPRANDEATTSLKREMHEYRTHCLVTIHCPFVQILHFDTHTARSQLASASPPYRCQPLVFGLCRRGPPQRIRCSRRPCVRCSASGTAQAWRMWAEPAVLPDVAASFVLPLLADASAGEMAPNAVFHALLRVSAAFVYVSWGRSPAEWHAAGHAHRHGRLRAPGDILEDPSSRYSRRPPPATRHLLPDNLASRRQPPTAPASNRRQCFRPMTRAQIVCIVAVESLGQASLPQCTDGETPWPTDDTSR